MNVFDHEVAWEEVAQEAERPAIGSLVAVEVYAASVRKRVELFPIEAELDWTVFDEPGDGIGFVCMSILEFIGTQAAMFNIQWATPVPRSLEELELRVEERRAHFAQ